MQDFAKISKIRETFSEILVKMRFSDRKCRHYGKKGIFRKKRLRQSYDSPFPLNFCKKSEKINEQILRKIKKPYFRAVLGAPVPIRAEREFFRKIRPRHFLELTKLHHCAKNQKKLMSGS